MHKSRNYQAPVEEALTKGINVLDSGCGPGTWVFEMAEDFPASQFYGVDIVPTFPESIKPKNVTFNVANITEPLPYPDAHFDYIYQRLMIFSLTKEQWQLAIRELVRKLRPGGTIELMEADCHWTNMGPLAQILNKAIIDLFIFRGLVPDVSEKMGTYCEDHGLRNVHIVRHRLTINHGGRIGALHW
ncbi:S-adenosyl-L-methionine-dependent methyltransferase [Gongronella butleri]|nr:S-adenosyl-L-methionine-dependent methyltransferase [Gongronella butleri]